MANYPIWQKYILVSIKFFETTYFSTNITVGHFNINNNIFNRLDWDDYNGKKQIELLSFKVYSTCSIFGLRKNKHKNSHILFYKLMKDTISYENIIVSNNIDRKAIKYYIPQNNTSYCQILTINKCKVTLYTIDINKKIVTYQTLDFGYLTKHVGYTYMLPNNTFLSIINQHKSSMILLFDFTNKCSYKWYFKDIPWYNINIYTISSTLNKNNKEILYDILSNEISLPLVLCPIIFAYCSVWT